MTEVAECLAFGGFFFLCGTLAWLGYFNRVRPSSAMMLFLFVQYGPAFLVDVRHQSAVDPDYTFNILDFGAEIARYTYTSLAIAFCGMAIGYAAMRFAESRIDIPRFGYGNRSPDFVGRDLAIVKQFYVFILLIAGISTIGLLAIPAIRMQLDFMAHLLTGHVATTDYTVMRRIILPSDPFSGFLTRMHMNYALPLMALLAAFGTYLKRPLWERFLVIGGFGMVGMLDLKKEPIAIAILTAIIAPYLTKRGAVFPRPRDLALPAGILASFSMILLFGLYELQYAANSNITSAKILPGIYFRVFQANGIDLNLFFVFVKHGLWSQGQTSSSVLAAVFNKTYFDLGAYIPQVYGALTTYPTIFYGASWADFGWTGIVLSSLCVGALAALADFVASTMRVAPVRAAYSVCAMFALNYFTQVQFLTCLFTYGIMLQMFVFLAIDYFLTENMRDTGRTNIFNVPPRAAPSPPMQSA